MYIDALVKGIDEMPDVDPEVRRSVFARYEEEGLDGILSELRLLDPAYYERVDRKNYKRAYLRDAHLVAFTLKAFKSDLGRLSKSDLQENVRSYTNALTCV